MTSRAHSLSAARSRQHTPPFAEDCQRHVSGPIYLTSLLRIVQWAGLAWLFSMGMAAADGSPRGQFTVWAIGLPNGYIIMEHQAQVVRVTAEDAARGMVEVRGGSLLVVVTHAPSRYALDFLNRSTVFRPTRIDGMGDVAELNLRGGSPPRTLT
jgi:hypothetical protein